MSRHSSDERFIADFRANFAMLKGQPIALYGIGEKTGLIVEKCSEFSIVGLMDREAVGRTVYGLRVLSNDEAIAQARAIVIVANMSLVDLIYQRIAFLSVRHGIEIYYVNGTRPETVDASIGDDPLWDANGEALAAAIDKSDIVSFDVFDTLIMRNVPHPTDLFDLVERRLKEEQGIILDFKSKRIEAERCCYHTVSKYCTIHDIYQTLREMLGISGDLAEEIKRIEIATELQWCLPRKRMVDFFNKAHEIGKTVICTTDSFLTRDLLVPMLDICGIAGYDRLFISCEEKKLKHLGDMWEYVRKEFPGKSILHIGDNRRADVETANSHGLAAFEIGSAATLLDRSSIGTVREKVHTLDDGVVIGLQSARFLSDPFALSKTKGFLSVNSMFDVGYLAFGPLVVNFLVWLVNLSHKKKIDTLLFFARDGYLLERLYRKIVAAHKESMPRGVYFLTSRRAASVAGIVSNDDIEFIVRNMCKIKKIKIGTLIKTAFGIEADAADALAQKYFFEVGEKSLVEHLVKNYGRAILANAEEERKGYNHYIASIGLTKESSLGGVNFIGRGITQKFTEKILGKSMEGFYFATEYDMLDIFDSLDNINALYGACVSPHTSRLHLCTKNLFGEAVFSAPHEQFVKFDRDGTPRYDERNKPRNFTTIADCHAGIERFLDDMMALDDRLLSRRFSNDLVDELFGLFFSIRCRRSAEVDKGFVFSDYYNPAIPEVTLTLPQPESASGAAL
jgi:predicted HAD superfamily hydrolase